MQPFDSGIRDQHHLASLNAGLAIASDDVWLDHDSLAAAKRLRWYRPGRAAFTAEDRRQIAATIAVQEVVNDGEAGLLNHAGRLDHL